MSAIQNVTDRERDLAAQVEVMREALINANEQLDGWRKSFPNYGDSEEVACQIDDAIALPNTAADILRQPDAQTKAEMLRMLADGQDAFDEGTGLLPFQMRKMAEELEENNG